MSHPVRWVALAAVITVSLTVVAPAVGRGEETAVQDEQRALLREGARLWPVTCNSCHNARGPAERSAAEWETILQHMRTVANIPGADARAILEYLKRR